MQRAIGHPARWLDLAFAIEEVQNRFECTVEIQLFTRVEPGKHIGVTVTVALHARRAELQNRAKRIERNTFRWLATGYSFPEQVYATVWECFATAEVVWPAAAPKEVG